MMERQIPYNGSVTFWTASGGSHKNIESAFAAVGLQEYCPSQRTEGSSLKLALDKYAQGQCPVGMDYEVSSLKQPGTNGYEVVFMLRGTVRNQRQHALSANVSNGIVSITSGSGSTGLIQANYNAIRAMVTPDAIGRSLVRLATEKLDGLCLRPNGGLYWIPDTQCEMWSSYATMVEQATGSQVTTAVWEANASTIARVRESLLADVDKECNEMLQALSDGQEHDDLYYDRRARRMERVLHRVETVESALQESLTDCRRRLELVQNVFTAATMASL